MNRKKAIGWLAKVLNQFLSDQDKIDLACQLFGCQMEVDNHWQVVLYTNLRWKSIGQYREMKDCDYESN